MPERFTVDTLLHAFEPVLEQLPDHRTGRNVTYAIKDAVLSALAVFFMQSPSFLAPQASAWAEQCPDFVWCGADSLG